MNLCDLELDIPYSRNDEYVAFLMNEKDYSLEKATQTDYAEHWKEKRHKFRMQTRCVSSYFSRNLDKISNDYCWKIVVECLTEIDNDAYRIIDGVLFVPVQFDVDSFFELEEFDKKRITTDLLINGISKVNSILPQVTDRINQIETEFKKENYDNSWTWKSLTKKKTEITIRISHLLNEVIICADIYTPGKHTTKEIARTLPDEWYYSKFLHKLKLVDEQHAYLETSDGNRIELIDVTN